MLAYQLIGQGPVLVMLHGFLADSRDFNHIVKQLTRDYRCLLIDLPGHGQSADVMVNDMSKVAEHIKNILINENIHRATIYGYSMGGRVALQFACLYPDMCQKLILESSSPGIENHQLRRQRQQSDQILAQKILENYHDFIKKWRQQPLFHSQKKLSIATQQKQLEMNMSQQPHGMASSLITYGTGVQESLWSYLPSIQHPCLLICGQLDIKFIEIAQQMYQLSPKYIKIVVVNEAGHNVHLEQPEVVIELLKKERKRE